MKNITFYNVLPGLKQACENFKDSLNLEALPVDVEVIFPFDVPQLRHNPVFNYCPKWLWLEKELKNETYRICFMPKLSSNTVAAHRYMDLLVEYTHVSLGQENIHRIPFPNYYRLPMWAVELFGVIPTYQEIEDKIAELEAKRKQNPLLREKFLACVAHRDLKLYLRGAREMIYNLLKDDPELAGLTYEFAGRLLNNTSDLQEKYQDQIVPYLEQFSFNICTESMNFLSYVSEKLAFCLEAGCIPIYWGDLESDKEIFNQDAMVIFDPTRRLNVVKRVKAILADPEAFLAEPIFQPLAARKIFSQIYAPFLAKIEQDLQIDVYSLRKDKLTGVAQINSDLTINAAEVDNYILNPGSLTEQA